MKFWKYSGAGNDFVLFDGEHRQDLDSKKISQLCDRKFGIGADGVLFVSKLSANEFQMNYFNADGGEVEMCGNGARACVHWFCTEYDVTNVSFQTGTGAHYNGNLLSDTNAEVTMNELKDQFAIDVSDFYTVEDSCYMNTGVPHCVYLLDDSQNLESDEWMKFAPKVRYDQRFQNGCNVNFAKVISPGKVAVRTYERGVEGETMACGTGAVAVARLMRKKMAWDQVEIQVLGGVLSARFSGEDCWLSGPVSQVFTGNISL